MSTVNKYSNLWLHALLIFSLFDLGDCNLWFHLFSKDLAWICHLFAACYPGTGAGDMLRAEATYRSGWRLAPLP
ncbi:hypothetical protein J3E68DRAFT_409540 [Trichoderma sp. SZMC 28012]